MSVSTKEYDPRILGLIAVILLDLLVASFIAWQIVTYRHYPFDSDEALHATRGLELAFDLRRGDLGTFLRHSYQQSVYPPGFAWFEALTFLLFGTSTITARLCSLTCLLGTTLVMYAIGLELDGDWGWLIGLIAVGLTLTAQTVLVHAALVMLGMPGLLVSLATLLAYLRATKRPTVWGFVTTSLLLALTLLTKYPYGIVVSSTIGLAELLAVLSSPSHHQLRAMARRWLWLFIPFALVMGGWFAGEKKIDDFIYYATLQPKHADWYSLENLIFYPRSIALHYTPSPFFVPVTLAGVVWAAAHWRHRNLRLILIYCFIGLLVMTLKESNNPRFIATVAPAIHLLTGAMLAQLAAAWTRNRTQVQRRVVLYTVALFLSLLASLPMLVERFAVLPSLLEVEYETDPRAHELAAWITDQAHGQRLYFINTWDQFSTFAMEWHLATHSNQHDFRFGDLFVPDKRLRTFTPEQAEELESQIRFYSTRYVVVLESGLTDPQVWPEYEHAFADFLVPVAVSDFPLEFYNLGGWLQTALATRESLARAKADNRITLNVRATVYRLLEQTSPGETEDYCLPTGSPFRVTFGSSEDTAYVSTGWYLAEDIGGVRGRWSGGIPTATLRFCLSPQTYHIRFRSWAYPPNQMVTLRVNDVEITALPVLETWKTYTATIPATVIEAGEPTEIQFVHTVLLSPYERTQGESPDERPLGAAYDWMVIEPCAE